MNAVPSARPLTILIAALGGEGGAVLADWLLAAATAAGFPVQSTSIPGVAQRTGATTYYLELYPVRAAELGGRSPVFALTPSPDNLDLVVASELVEAGRTMQNGYVTARTTLIAATHRVYATSEKLHGGDGRFDASRILAAGPRLARRAAFIDMARLAQDARTVISAVMFGAIAGSDVLPLAREQCEAAIRAGGVGVDASLKGFAAGFAAMRGSSPAAVVEAADEGAPASRGGTIAADAAFDARVASLPPSAQPIVREGIRRALDFQDAAYATQYLDRLDSVVADAGAAGVASDLVRETARFLALWMCYEDIFRVAQLKSQPARFDRVRADVGAKPGEPIRITEYMRPGAAEIADAAPRPFARRIRKWAEAREQKVTPGFGMRVATSSIGGYALLRLLGSWRRFRRRSSRFHAEQAQIDAWLAAIRAALGAGQPELALEIALAARLRKGYGETHDRTVAHFDRVMAIAADASLARDERVAAMRAARDHALAMPDAPAIAKPIERPVRFEPRTRDSGRAGD